MLASYIKPLNYRAISLLVMSLIILAITSGCQTTSNTKTEKSISQYLTPPVYTGDIQPIIAPINISFNNFGKGEQIINSKIKIFGSSDPKVNDTEMDSPVQVLKLESRNHHEGVLWRLKIKMDEKTNEELEVEIIRSPNGKILNMILSSSNSATPKDTLKIYERILKSTFAVQYNHSLMQGDDLIVNFDSVMKDVLSGFGLGGSFNVTGNSKVAGSTKYNNKMAIVAFTNFNVSFKGAQMALSAYSIIDINTGVTLQEKSNTIVYQSDGSEEAYISTSEIKEFNYNE